MIDETHPTIAEFQLSLMLLAPSSFIATDIRTGFPNLISNERLNIDQLVVGEFNSYCRSNDSSVVRPLLFADNYLQLVENDLADYFNNHESIQLISCNIQLFTDILTPTQVQLHSTNTDDYRDMR